MRHTARFLVLIFFFIITAFFTHTAYALVAGDIDPSFFTGVPAGASSPVSALTLQPDGKILIGGSFTTYNGTTANRIVRLNTDGTLDTTFTTGTGASSLVSTITLQSDGKILIGGNFTTYNGTTINRIARLNTDGTLDTTFTTGTGAGGIVNTITLQSDGKILIGGNFTTYNGTTANRIARLNTDGTLDTTFTTGTGASSLVSTSTLQSDGKILIGGNFTTYNGTTANRIARLNTDGTLDTTFTTGTGASNTVDTITLQPDGKILIGGSFTTYNGTTAKYIARLNTDGTLDTAFAAGAGAGYTVEAISLQPDGKILIGGWFTTYSGTIVNRIARLNTDGTRDTTFTAGSGVNDTVYAITPQPDGKILIGGPFTTYNGTAINRIARLNTDGTLDTTFTTGTGAGGIVNTITLQPDGKILIGGWFTTYNGTTANRIARLNTDGTLDTTFTTGTAAHDAVLTITLQSDGKILIGGGFTTYNGTTANRIARLNTDGTLDTTFTTGTGVNNIIKTITLQPDGKILIGGDFTTYNGTTVNYIARLNTDGTLDTTFAAGTGAGYTVEAISLQPDGKILVGGRFTAYNGTTVNRIARLNADGTLDTTFTTGVGADDIVYAIALQPDGKIIICGEFTTYNDTTANYIARLNADGTLDATFTTGTGVNGPVYIITLQPDDKAIIAGEFTNYNGTPAAYLTRILLTSIPSDGTTLTTTIASNISLDCTQTGQTNDKTIEFGTITPGTPITQSLTCTVSTNSTNGYTLTTQRNTATATMRKDATHYITDRTNWDPQNPNATLWQTHDTGLAFTVYSSTANKNNTWWGTGTTYDDTNNKYAGIPPTAQPIMTASTYSATPTETHIGYKLDVPTTQQAGIYQGTVTYQVTVNP